MRRARRQSRRVPSNLPRQSSAPRQPETVQPQSLPLRTETPSRPQESLSGLIERVTFFNEENGWAVLKVKAKGHRDLVAVVGSVPSVSAGEWVTAEGSWVQDREFGLQFRAIMLNSTAPTTREGIEKYLLQPLQEHGRSFIGYPHGTRASGSTARHIMGSVAHIPIFNLRQFSGSWKGSRELPCSGAGLSARKPQYCSSFCPDHPAIVSFFRPALRNRCKSSTVHRRRANSSSRMRWPFCWFVSFPNRCQSQCNIIDLPHRVTNCCGNWPWVDTFCRRSTRFVAPYRVT
jgi:hypothetical protein